MKKLLLCTLIVCLSLLLVLPVAAGDATPPCVTDDADLFTLEQEAQLERTLSQMASKHGHGFAVVTVTSMNGRDPLDFAYDYYDEHGYGVGNTRSGALLVISMPERRYALVVNGALDDIMTENDLTKLEHAVVNELSDERFYQAAVAFADTCEHIITYDNSLAPIWFVIAPVLGAGIAALVLWLMTRKHKSVKAQRSADSYMRRDTFHLDRSRDVYLYSHVTRVAKPQNSSSSRRSGGGGGSRSGRGGRF